MKHGVKHGKLMKIDVKRRRFYVFLQRFYRYLQHRHDAENHKISRLSRSGFQVNELIPVWSDQGLHTPSTQEQLSNYVGSKVPWQNHEEMCETRQIIQ